MPYQSPLHILDSLEFAPDKINTEGLNRLRKKLLAEFSLNPAVTIDIKGKAYTKDEILKTIDSLKETDNLVGHQFIFQNKNLLNWLENPTQVAMLPTKEIIEAVEGSVETALVKDALNQFVKYNFSKRNFDRVITAIRLVINHFDTIFTSIYDLIFNEINGIIKTINDAKKSPNVKQNIQDFGFIRMPIWTDLLNNLPDVFDSIRDNYCRTGVNYTVSVEKLNKKWSYEISSQLKQTVCDESVKTLIYNNHEVFERRYHVYGCAYTINKILGYILIIVPICVIIFFLIWLIIILH